MPGLRNHRSRPTTNLPEQAAAGRSERYFGRRRPYSIRISRWALRMWKGREFFTSRCQPGIPTETWFRCSLPRFPNVENGGVAVDGMSVTWKLKTGVQWHDGQPFTADDLVFNWEYASDPATAATTIGSYQDVEVEKIDPFTVRVRFQKPTPFWAGRANGLIIPKHLFEPYKGANSREAPANLKPVGTGPYRFVDFAPGDFVKGERNPTYHLPDRPYFDTIELKGGGDAVSAARAVIQTGEFDFAWNTQVEDEVLLKLESSATAKGRVDIVAGMAIEHIQLNTTDPWTEVDGERSSAKTKHPLFSDPGVRRVLGLLV